MVTANQIQCFFLPLTKVEAEDDFVAAEVEDAMASVQNHS